MLLIYAETFPDWQIYSKEMITRTVCFTGDAFLGVLHDAKIQRKRLM